MSLFSGNTDITDGIDSNIRKAIEMAIANNSIESFSVLEAFVRHVLQLSIRNNSLKHFQKYIFFLAYFYSASYEKAKRNSALLELHKFCSQQAAIHLKEIIWFDIGYFERQVKRLEEKEKINQFYHLAFQGFSRLLYFIVKNGDINQFRLAVDEYEQISEGITSQNFEIKWEIRDLETENTDGRHDSRINEIKEELRITKEFDTYKRHVLTGIKYWIFFLYKEGKMQEETVIQFLESLKIPYADSEDLLNDILFFHSNPMRFYMGWKEWDFTERRSGKIFSPPDPKIWLTSGFFIDQIREKRFYINLNELDSEEISLAKFLYIDLKRNAEYYEKNFNKWSTILKVNTLGEFKSKSDEILKDFALIKRKSITDRDREIAVSSLYSPHVDKFKKLIGEAWKSQARIHFLFKFLGNLVNVNDQNINLKQIGRRTFFEKAKMMFTEENNQMIHGVDRMGGETGRLEDNYFFTTIRQKGFNSVSGANVLQILEESLIELGKKNVAPTLILLAPEYAYKDKDFLESKWFVSKLIQPHSENDLEKFNIGTFKGIPIYSSFSNLLKNSMLICNFFEAFQMQYKSSPNWFEEELNVNVFEVSDDEAKRRLSENRIKWTSLEDGGTLNDEEALLLIKTSVNIDIWTTIEFKILNNDAYIIGFIKSEIDED